MRTAKVLASKLRRIFRNVLTDEAADLLLEQEDEIQSLRRRLWGKDDGAGGRN